MLGEPTHIYKASITGDFQPNSAPCDQELKLRVGARVMMLVNDPAHVYCNGSLGEVVALNDKVVTVRLESNVNPWLLCIVIAQANAIGNCVQEPLSIASTLSPIMRYSFADHVFGITPTFL